MLEKSYADVSFLAGLLIDKFRFHLPLYRQHQRLEAGRIKLSRSTLTHLVHGTAELLEPIYHAQVGSILSSRVVAMDETPIKAGRKKRGKMQTAYFWPIYGGRDEIVFPFSPSRGGGMVQEALKEYCGVLISDGYRAYDDFAAKMNQVVHAQCWAHVRRQFVEAVGSEPELCKTALDRIGDLYGVEKKIRERGLEGEKKLAYRGEHAKPIADGFFTWLKETTQERILLPTNPFTQAANYALKRKDALKVFLEYPDVPIDTNHLEREIRPIAIGRKNWMFCWTEVGARYVGIVQSLLATCRLQGVDPYTYLVDVLQRIATHPADRVWELTPRVWKERFGHDPLTSDIDRLRSP